MHAAFYHKIPIKCTFTITVAWQPGWSICSLGQRSVSKWEMLKIRATNLPLHFEHLWERKRHLIGSTVYRVSCQIVTDTSLCHPFINFSDVSISHQICSDFRQRTYQFDWKNVPSHTANSSQKRRKEKLWLCGHSEWADWPDGYNRIRKAQN